MKLLLKKIMMIKLNNMIKKNNNIFINLIIYYKFKYEN